MAPSKLERLHQAYLLAEVDPDLGIARVLRALAKQHGVPFKEADRAHTMGHWELERRGRRSEVWAKEHGGGARTEEEFVRYCVENQWAHLSVDGPEGVRLAAAFGRDIWRRAMGSAMEWRAAVALDEARAEYDAVQAVRKEIEAKRNARRAA